MKINPIKISISIFYCLFSYSHSVASEHFKEVQLGGDQIEEACIANYGKSLVFKLTGNSNVFMLGLGDNSVKRLKLYSNDFLLASGGGKIIALHTNKNILEVFDAHSLKKIKVKKIFSNYVFSNLCMGSHNDSHALIMYKDKQKKYHSINPSILNLQDFSIKEMVHQKEVEPVRRYQKQRIDKYYGMKESYIFVNSNFKYASMLHAKTNPSKFLYFRMNLDKMSYYFIEGSDMVTAGLSENGDYVMGYETIFSDKLRKSRHFKQSFLYGSIDGPIFTELTKDGVINVCGLQNSTVYNSLQSPIILLKSRFRYKNPLRQVVFSSLKMNCIVIVDYKNSKVYSGEMFKDNVPDILKQSYNYSIKKGKLWELDLVAFNNDSVDLVDGPKNLKIDGAKLSWDVSKSHPNSYENIILKIKQNDGAYNYLLLKVELL